MNVSHTQHDHVSEPRMQPLYSLKDFAPLIGIAVVIFIFTFIMQYRLGYWDAAYAMRNFMAGFFLVFGSFKLMNWGGFVNAYQIYDLVAMRSRIYAYAYPLIEVGLGTAYLLDYQIIAVSWTTFVLMIVGAVGVARQLMKKETVPCACLGVVFKIPMTKVTLAEDVLMAGMALGMIFGV